jgi:hypothetical protein
VTLPSSGNCDKIGIIILGAWERKAHSNRRALDIYVGGLGNKDLESKSIHVELPYGVGYKSTIRTSKSLGIVLIGI